MNPETQKQLIKIKEIFNNNNLNISFKGVQNTPFIKKITCMIDNLKNTNKIKNICNSLNILLNTKINFYFENDFLILELNKINYDIQLFDKTINADLKNKNMLFFGIDKNNNKIYESLNNTKSILIAGTSGSGKSNLLHNLILSYLLLNNNTYLFLIDPKYTELSYYNNKLKNRLVLPVAFDYESIIKCLCAFYNLIKTRFKNMMKNKKRISSDPTCLLIIDEYAQTFNNTKQKNKINDYISKIASIGRAANCFIILTTQHPTNANINNTIRSNLQTKIALRCESSQQSYNILGNADATKLLKPGEFIFKCDGQKQIELYSSYISDATITKIINN